MQPIVSRLSERRAVPFHGSEQSFEHLLQMRSELLLSVPVMLLTGTGLLYSLTRYAGLQAGTRASKSLVLISAAIVGGSLAVRGVTGIYAEQ